MLKAADALEARGYDVRVVSARHTRWATAADVTVRATRSWRWTVVDYSRDTARTRQLMSGLRLRAAQAVTRRIAPSRAWFGLAVRAYSRVHDELVRAIVSEPADFIYGGTTGALAAVAEAAGRLAVPYAIDLEDFHSGEEGGADSSFAHRLAEQVERGVLANAAFLTAGSPMIADAYAATYGVRPRTIHNTFSIRFGSNAGGPRPLRLYWVSQTLGLGRGLEEVIEAVGRAGIPAELHVRASAVETSLTAMRSFQQAVAPALMLVHHEPASPDEMVRLADGYDLGLSCEVPAVLNRRLCLGNKIFTYLAAGLPVVLSGTPAQARFAATIGPAGLVYEPGNADDLADQLRRWTGDPVMRSTARRAAQEAATRRWHWEHPDDRGALLAAVEGVVPSSARDGRETCAS
jgi:hypothetical protein